MLLSHSVIEDGLNLDEYSTKFPVDFSKIDNINLRTIKPRTPLLFLESKCLLLKDFIETN